jgi:transcriptional regulator with XRE-family HTH domain
LAYDADLDRSYIASVESGQRNISIVNIEKIANALKVSLKEFFEDEKFTGSKE